MYVTCSLSLKVLKGLPSLEGRPGASLAPVDFDKLRVELEEKHGHSMSDYDLVSSTLYPRVFDDFHVFRRKYGPVDKIDTKNFLVGPDIAEDIDVSLVDNYTSFHITCHLCIHLQKEHMSSNLYIYIYAL